MRAGSGPSIDRVVRTPVGVLGLLTVTGADHSIIFTAG